MASILVVDDELSMREFLKIFLEKEGYATETVSDGNKALDTLNSRTFDLVISDIRMPDLDGIHLLSKIKAVHENLPVVLITAYASPEDAVMAMKNGAFDYITKPFKVEEIRTVIQAAIEKNRETALEAPSPSFPGIIGNSPEMRKIFDLVRRIAPTHANVLIQGESGTGKELIASAIHHYSAASENPFVPIICSAIPESLFESELFGHTKGSFTGATANKKGLFESANNGSVFLDEIGELTHSAQTKLLRVLQEREFKPVGGNETIKVNIRIISATNRDLEQEVINGSFREDLFYRLAVIPIRIPPLRERKGDIPPLVEHFLKKYSGLFNKEVREMSTYAMKVLLDYDFPGNVRELENIIERGVAMESSNIILPESLTLSAHRQGQQKKADQVSEPCFQEDALFDRGIEAMLADIEMKMINTALKRAGNSKIKAADLLKISFRQLRYKIQKYELD